LRAMLLLRPAYCGADCLRHSVTGWAAACRPPCLGLGYSSDCWSEYTPRLQWLVSTEDPFRATISSARLKLRRYSCPAHWQVQCWPLLGTDWVCYLNESPSPFRERVARRSRVA